MIDIIVHLSHILGKTKQNKTSSTKSKAKQNQIRAEPGSSRNRSGVRPHYKLFGRCHCVGGILRESRRQGSQQVRVGPGPV